MLGAILLIWLYFAAPLLRKCVYMLESSEDSGAKFLCFGILD